MSTCNIQLNNNSTFAHFDIAIIIAVKSLLKNKRRNMEANKKKVMTKRT